MNNVLNEANTSHGSWNNLSMQEKAAMIRVAVKNGLTDLKTIREKYNEFAGGGSKRRQESVNNAATQQAMQYFMGKGLTDYQAAGLVGNLFRESRLNPTAVNSGSGAYGIAQWLGSRKKNLFAKYGNNPSLAQQLDYVWHELNNTHKTGLNKLMSSRDSEEAARNAMGYYEFSAGPEAAIREMRRWNQDGEGAMQKGINFASQLIGGPVVPFRAETPQWNNIPFTPANPEVFFSNPVTTSQPVVDMEPTKTPMLEYDPKEAERQEKRDNLSRFNMFLSMLNGSNESTFPFSMFAEGGKIHISPSKKGTFTAAASRHNMGVQEFASKVLANKDDYSPAMVKKANFARNARHWKHGLGGNLFEDGGPKKPLTRDDLRRMLLNRRAEAETAYNGSVTETQIIPNDNAWVDKPLTRRKKNPHSSRRAEEGAKAHAAWEREHPNLAAWGNLAGAVPFAVAAAPLGAGIVAGGDALAATTAGQAITSGLAPLYQAATGATIAGAPALTLADAGLTSAFGAHGISQAVEDGGISPMAALEIAPLGRLARPMYEGIVQPGMRLFNSPLTGNWTKIGNREYRLSPNSLGANGSPIESRKIGDYSVNIDLNKMRNIFEDYEKGLTRYKGAQLSNPLEYKLDIPKINIDFNNLTTDNFVDYLSKQTGRTLKRVPIKDTPHSSVYNEGFAFIDENGKEVAHIAGTRKGGKNVWVESSFVDPEFRYQGLGKQMYFDLNDHVFGTYGTTLHSDPYQRVGSTGVGMSPSNRLWKSLREKGLSSVEGEGLNKYDVMVEPSKITTAYRTTAPQITVENAASITPEQWNAAYRAAYERGDKAEGQRLWDLWFRQHSKNNKLTSENNFPIKLRHNTDSEPWNIYDESHFNSATGDGGWYGKGLYTSGNSWGETAYGKNTMYLYGYMENPAVIPPANIGLNDIPENFTTGYIARDFFNRGISKEDYVKNLSGDALEWSKVYPELISKAINNTEKADGIIVQKEASRINPFAPFQEVVLPKGTHIKSAEPFTLDDSGRLIDLTDRANFNINDIRYGLLPFGIGLTGYGLWQENE